MQKPLQQTNLQMEKNPSSTQKTITVVVAKASYSIITIREEWVKLLVHEFLKFWCAATDRNFGLSFLNITSASKSQTNVKCRGSIILQPNPLRYLTNGGSST
jgi:hypothetical protein